MPLTVEATRAYGEGVYVQHVTSVTKEVQIGYLQQIIAWLGGDPVPDPVTSPILAVDIDLDNDGDPDVRVTVDDIPEPEEE